MDTPGIINNILTHSPVFGNAYSSMLSAKAFLIKIESGFDIEEDDAMLDAREFIADELETRQFFVDAQTNFEINFNKRLLCEIMSSINRDLTRIMASLFQVGEVQPRIPLPEGLVGLQQDVLENIRIRDETHWASRYT